MRHNLSGQQCLSLPRRCFQFFFTGERSEIREKYLGAALSVVGVALALFLQKSSVTKEYQYVGWGMMVIGIILLVDALCRTDHRGDEVDSRTALLHH